MSQALQFRESLTKKPAMTVSELIEYQERLLRQAIGTIEKLEQEIHALTMEQPTEQEIRSLEQKVNERGIQLLRAEHERNALLEAIGKLGEVIFECGEKSQVQLFETHTSGSEQKS